MAALFMASSRGMRCAAAAAGAPAGGGRARPRLRAQPEDGEGGRSSGRLRDHGASPARLAQAFLL
jgi:hypothetical protein